MHMPDPSTDDDDDDDDDAMDVTPNEVVVVIRLLRLL
jgi:hypothetical protein